MVRDPAFKDGELCRREGVLPPLPVRGLTVTIEHPPGPRRDSTHQLDKTALRIDKQLALIIGRLVLRILEPEEADVNPLAVAHKNPPILTRLVLPKGARLDGGPVEIFDVIKRMKGR
jgi:hypothetical protein